MELLSLENEPLILNGSRGTYLPTATITYAEGYHSINYTNSQGVYTTITLNNVAGKITDALKGTLIVVVGSIGSPTIGSGATRLSDLANIDGTLYVIDSTSVIFNFPSIAGGSAP